MVDTVEPRKRSTWHSNGGEELEPLFAFTFVVDVRWLLKFARGGVSVVVPAWQQLPAEAAVKLEDLRSSTMWKGLPVAVLSYGWSSKALPLPPSVNHPNSPGRLGWDYVILACTCACLLLPTRKSVALAGPPG